MAASLGVISTISPSVNGFCFTLFVEELKVGITPTSVQERVFQELLFVGGQNLYNFADSFNGCFHGFIRFCFTIFGMGGD